MDAARLIHPEEAARIAAVLRGAARTGVRVASAAGFAGVMWLLLAGPGFLDGRSSAVDHAARPGATRHAAR